MVIWKIAATVANSDESPVYSIKSQNPAGVLGLEGNKIVIADTSAVDYDTNTELKGEIQATAGSATATAAFTFSITDDAGIYIPDAKFKAVLVKNTALNTDGDQEISVAEAQAFTGGIQGTNLGITDATGIEYFTNVTQLDLGRNALTAIDVSKNSALTSLELSLTQLIALDVSQNTVLTYLDLNDNNLIDINVSKNTALTNLKIRNNKLTALDVSNNTALTELRVKENNLIALDVSKNKVLTILDVDANNLTALNVSNNTALTQLYVGFNNLTDIDVSKNTKLFNLWIYKNALTRLDVSQNTALIDLFLYENALTDIDVSQNIKLRQLLLYENDLTKVNLANGNNTKLTNLNLLENPALTCAQVDQLPIPTAWTKYSDIKIFQTEACQ